MCRSPDQCMEPDTTLAQLFLARGRPERSRLAERSDLHSLIASDETVPYLITTMFRH